MLSKLDLFSEDQAITATALSTNACKLHKFQAKSTPLELHVQVTEDFDNLTSMAIEVHEADAVDGSYSVAAVTRDILLAELKAGAKLPLEVLPAVKKEWVKLNYVVTGTAPTAGKITAAITPRGGDDPIEDGQYFSPRNSSGAKATA